MRTCRARVAAPCAADVSTTTRSLFAPGFAHTKESFGRGTSGSAPATCGDPSRGEISAARTRQEMRNKLARVTATSSRTVAEELALPLPLLVKE